MISDEIMSVSVIELFSVYRRPNKWRAKQPTLIKKEMDCSYILW
jgi:hypothetical protein